MDALKGGFRGFWFGVTSGFVGWFESMWVWVWVVCLTVLVLWICGFCCFRCISLLEIVGFSGAVSFELLACLMFVLGVVADCVGLVLFGLV